MNAKVKELSKILPSADIKLDYPLANITSLKIGGPADILYIPETQKELIDAVKKARELDIPVTLLGGGTNILISDRGLRGLVIKNTLSKFKIFGEKKAQKNDKSSNKPEIQARWQSDKTKGTFKYEFKDLNYYEKDVPRVQVYVESGMSLQNAIYDFIDHGLTGLQWFAGIPGTLGAAVHNNIHGGERFFDEILDSVKVLTPKNTIKTYTIDDLGLEYDKSRFHESGEIILEMILSLYKGDCNRAKFTADEWKKRKSIQPKNSPGSIFRNISNETKDRLGYPTTSIGYIVEHIIKMPDYRVGDASIAEAHKNFIVNMGKASSKDFLTIVKEVIKRTKEQIGVELTPEIFFLGFDKDELKGVLY